MGGEGAMSGANISLSNNRALLKKRRLKDHPYLKADTVKRMGKADYQELKAWRLNRSRIRWRRRWTVIIISTLAALTSAFLVIGHLL